MNAATDMTALLIHYLYRFRNCKQTGSIFSIARLEGSGIHIQHKEYYVEYCET